MMGNREFLVFNILIISRKFQIMWVTFSSGGGGLFGQNHRHPVRLTSSLIRSPYARFTGSRSQRLTWRHIPIHLMVVLMISFCQKCSNLMVLFKSLGDRNSATEGDRRGTRVGNEAMISY